MLRNATHCDTALSLRSLRPAQCNGAMDAGHLCGSLKLGADDALAGGHSPAAASSHRCSPYALQSECAALPPPFATGLSHGCLFLQKPWHRPAPVCWLAGCLAASGRPHLRLHLGDARPRRASLMIGRVAASCMAEHAPGSTGCGRLCSKPLLSTPLLRMPSVAPPALSDTSAPLPAHDPRARPPRMSLLRAHSSRLRAATLCLASQSTCHMSARARRPQAGDERRRRTLCRPCRQTWRAATRSRSCPRSTKMSSCQR